MTPSAKTQSGSVRSYRFRAECQADVDSLMEIIGAKRSQFTMLGDPLLPEVKVTLESTLTLEKLRSLMLQVVDGHVMAQTVRYEEEYTGERDYEVGAA